MQKSLWKQRRKRTIHLELPSDWCISPPLRNATKSPSNYCLQKEQQQTLLRDWTPRFLCIPSNSGHSMQWQNKLPLFSKQLSLTASAHTPSSVTHKELVSKPQKNGKIKYFGTEAGGRGCYRSARQTSLNWTRSKCRKRGSEVQLKTNQATNSFSNTDAFELARLRKGLQHYNERELSIWLLAANSPLKERPKLCTTGTQRAQRR